MVRSSKPKKRKDGDDDLPHVFRDMLAETTTSSPSRTDDEGKAIKRRRVGGRLVTKVAERELKHTRQGSDHGSDDSQMSGLFHEPVVKRPDVVKTDSEDSTESDIVWEEVELQQHDAGNQDFDSPNSDEQKLNLVLGTRDDSATRMPRGVKRKPMTHVEKKLRLDIHKLHLCCLLAHVFIRNHWCDDAAVHKTIRGILSNKTISYLNPSEDKSQFQRSRSFMDGLEQASESFRNRFSIVARGMCKPAWAESSEALAKSQPPTDIDMPMQKIDFRFAAHEMKASRDVGAQLFCALLRSASVDARLICSLQTLPFSTSTPAVAAPQIDHPAYYSVEQKQGKIPSQADSDLDNEDDRDPPSYKVTGPLGGRTRFEPNAGDASESQVSQRLIHSKRRIRESKYPVFWVEAFNEASQKWVPIDPLVTKTIAKPSKLEPPAGDKQNSLTYVVAFEDDGSARDVTRRYAKAYNAKTRRDRVESTKGGDRWWKRVMKIYRRSHRLDRDEIDDAELAKKEAAEPMPRNVQDFMNHPYYALERHLRRHEAIHPKREVGKVSAGRSGGGTILEPIYRRRDVHNVQSADKWYRSMGREIKAGEQPLKRVPARRIREQSVVPDEHGEESAGTALYGIHQTTPYKAPSIVDGRVPKNAYGNLDIFVPSMIPSGGVHIEHSETVRAAKILGIDFAEAITGFTFKGRHGTAIKKGAVVAREHREAVQAIIAAFEDERLQSEEERRSHQAMRMWKRFLAGLRIRERIQGYTIEGERDAMQGVKDEMEEAEQEDGDGGGGFFPGQEVGDIAELTAGKAFETPPAMNREEADSFMLDNAVNQERSIERRPRDGLLDDLDDEGGGGFLVEDDHLEDGGQVLQNATGNNATIQDPPHPPIQPLLQSQRYAAESFKQVALKASSDRDTTGKDLPRNVFPLSNEITQEELDEARLLQELHEEERKRLPSNSTEENRSPLSQPQAEASSNPSEGASHLHPALPDVKKADVTLSTSPLTKAISQPGTPKSDKGSLLSEDPDDEDAEPDWLV